MIELYVKLDIIKKSKKIINTLPPNNFNTSYQQPNIKTLTITKTTTLMF